jgi:acyl-CoA thioesterase
MDAHVFDTAIALEATSEGEWRGRTSPAYANFIGPYGGITAAQAMNVVLQHPALLGEPVSLTVNYATALADGEFTARSRPARTNRSTQHWIVELLQSGETVATATAMTAARRDTWSGHEARMPDVPRPQDVPRTPRRGVEWLNRYDMRFFEGMPSFDPKAPGQETSVTRLWVRDDPQRPLDFASLTAMSDIFFPRIWLRRPRQVPLGTVTMTIYFHADSAQLAATGSGFLLAQARGEGFRNGYFDHTGHLWNEAGDLLVTTHQLVYYKE